MFFFSIDRNSNLFGMVFSRRLHTDLSFMKLQAARGILVSLVDPISGGKEESQSKFCWQVIDGSAMHFPCSSISRQTHIAIQKLCGRDREELALMSHVWSLRVVMVVCIGRSRELLMNGVPLLADLPREKIATHHAVDNSVLCTPANALSWTTQRRCTWRPGQYTKCYGCP